LGRDGGGIHAFALEILSLFALLQKNVVASLIQATCLKTAPAL
jgi:hypothetical protein